MVEAHRRGFHEPGRIGKDQNIGRAVGAFFFQALEEHLVFSFQELDFDPGLLSEFLVELLVRVVVPAAIYTQRDVLLGL